MTEKVKTDLCVIGAGSGGLSVAAGAAQMGARVVLLERAKMGGDCLNYGCVPSKSLLAAGHAAQVIRTANRFGVGATDPVIDHGAVRDHVQGVIAGIAPHDSQERFEGFGVRVIREAGRFTGPRTVVAGDAEITAKRIVIATGSSPAVPPIPGLDAIPYFTNETIFDNAEPIPHLLVIGGGPIGLEMAQAHARLGAKVTVLEGLKALGNDDPELAAIVMQRLAEENIGIHEGAMVKGFSGSAGEITVAAEIDGRPVQFQGSHVLMAVGRTPNLDGLDLEAAGIETGRGGIVVDARLRTTNKKVFAIGDAAQGYKFTHIAGYHAGIVIRNVLFRLPAKVDYRAVPWVTFTAPELAQVGLTETAARQEHGEITVLHASFAENDRAQAEAETIGQLKIMTTRKGVIVGASMVGEKAGELIQSWCLPIAKRMKIKDVAGLILPYPTLGEINKRAAGSFYTPSLFSDRTRRIVRFLLSFG
ncbi:MAG: FAD-dependent oxidoreductase [Rhodospirillaceae bacterium]|jgi:pyruvate/2-oxoglutarate dehydrogenase complex dihydrolipoamide dehydrogenase (E3) component|nr:FAD-dependent oxidoreductase [Rhodospirillaceae bacterium]MBT5455122.1 FAD-dependent oxidoreductase [Rhodospirillaceae bacterium]